VFVRKMYSEGPIVSFPLAPADYAVVVRFCPVLFELDADNSLFTGLQHLYIWAVATRTSIMIYSSSSDRPIAVFADYHYSTIYDLTWQEDKCLAACSNDGYCSFIAFEPGVFGVRHDPEPESKE
jgi:chromatin assembly factor 1 subunit B